MTRAGSRFPGLHGSKLIPLHNSERKQLQTPIPSSGKEEENLKLGVRGNLCWKVTVDNNEQMCVCVIQAHADAELGYGK